MSVELVMLSNYLILSCLLLLPSIFPSFSFSIGPSNEYSGLLSFRIDWFDLLAGQGILSLSLAIYKNVQFISMDSVLLS